MVSVHYPMLGTFEFPHFYEGFSNYYPDAEMETRRWCVVNIKPYWTVIDCGAHIGTYTYLFSRLANQVHAIEPTDTMEMLRKNLQHLKCENVYLYQVALGAMTGRFSEYIHKIWGEIPLFYEWEFTMLDKIVIDFKITKVDLIKIDVDSWDFDVLQGAQDTITKHGPIVIVELNKALELRNSSAQVVIEWLYQFGYKPQQVLDGENFVFERK